VDPSLLIAPLVLGGVAGAWFAVQAAWRRTFPRAGADADALAGRMGCHGCSRTDECDRRPDDPAGRCPEEEP
jgi:hypothetical protein